MDPTPAVVSVSPGPPELAQDPPNVIRVIAHPEDSDYRVRYQVRSPHSAPVYPMVGLELPAQESLQTRANSGVRGPHQKPSGKPAR